MKKSKLKLNKVRVVKVVTENTYDSEGRHLTSTVTTSEYQPR